MRVERTTFSAKKVAAIVLVVAVVVVAAYLFYAFAVPLLAPSPSGG